MDGQTPQDIDPYAVEAAQPVPLDSGALLQAIQEAGNVADLLPEEKLASIAQDVIRGNEIDEKSMKPWRDRMQNGIKLATLVKDEKNYPWEKASNVKYPLVTTAALQFNARAYPAIVPSGDIVKVKTFGADPGGKKSARADRVAAHMSWQLSAQVVEWEEVTDKLLTCLPIVGTVVRKVWYDPALMRVRVKMVPPENFVINMAVKTLEEAPRIGEKLMLYPSEITQRRRAGLFRDIDYVEEKDGDRHAPQEFLEQHCLIDLDEDGYEEPYIVTVCCASQKVARIVADWAESDVVQDERGVVSISRGSYFIPYHFLPSMDGGFMGTGLGLLLGDISDTVNTIINMMIDAGHMASLGGGFIGSEFRIKGGAQRFRPGEWKLTNSKGADIKQSIVPMTFPGPDATLFQLLGLLIEAGREVASVKDIMTGDDGGKNMTATTTLALIEQGMMVFTASYKRIFRSLKQEFRLLAKINAQNVTPEEYNQFHDVMGPAPDPDMPPEQAAMMGQEQMLDPAADYDLADMDLQPVADPSSVTKMQEAAKAQIVMQMAAEGLVDKAEAAKRVLQSASIADTEALMPKPDPMAEQMQMMQMMVMKADITLKMVSVQKAMADVEKVKTESMKNLSGLAQDESARRLDQEWQALEAMRNELGNALAGITSGMAGAPGNGGGIPGMEGVAGTPEPPMPGGLLGGQAMVGGGAPVAEQAIGFG